MNINLDKQTVTKIFDYLRDGKFLSSNIPNKNEKLLYEYIQNHYLELVEYFEFINIHLILKDGYCYFANYDNKENKLQTIYELLDILSFLYNFNSSFGVGFRFTISNIQDKIKDNITLDIKLKKIKSLSGDTLHSKILSLLNKLIKKGFLTLENEYLQQYIVLNSYEYLVEFFDKIEIRE
jgi:hypothetical protein